jgi:hypothetical protein
MSPALAKAYTESVQHARAPFHDYFTSTGGVTSDDPAEIPDHGLSVHLLPGSTMGQYRADSPVYLVLASLGQVDVTSDGPTKPSAFLYQTPKQDLRLSDIFDWTEARTVAGFAAEMKARSDRTTALGLEDERDIELIALPKAPITHTQTASIQFVERLAPLVWRGDFEDE